MGTNHEVSAVLRPAARAGVEEPEAPVLAPITYDQFKATEMLVGQIVSARPVPNTDKLVHLIVDFGPRGAKTVIAGILKSFPDPTVLHNKRCAFVTNLPARKMAVAGGVESQAMILAATSENDPQKVSLVEVPAAQVGSRLG